MAEAVWVIELDHLPLVVGIDAMATISLNRQKSKPKMHLRDIPGAVKAIAGNARKNRFFSLRK